MSSQVKPKVKFDLKSELQKCLNMFEEEIVLFVLSSKKKILICETPDVFIGGLRMMQFLEHIEANLKSEDTVLKNYVVCDQYSFLKWSDLEEEFEKSGKVTLNSNLSVVLFTDVAEINEKTNMILLNVLVQLLDPLKKIIFVSSRKNVLYEHIKATAKDSVMRLEEFYPEIVEDFNTKDNEDNHYCDGNDVAANKVDSSDLKNDKKFSNAILEGDLEQVSELIEQGVDINCAVEEQEEALTGDLIKYSALFVAASNGHTSIVELLMKNGAHFHEVNNYFGDTPLHIAVKNNHIDVVKCLLKFSRVDVNIENRMGETAFKIAVSNSYKNICVLLLDANADVKKKDHSGFTALMVGASRNNIDIVGELVSRRKNISINEKDCYGRTALCVAILNDDRDMADKLLKLGADINVQDNEGQTVLHFTVMKGRRSFVKFLLDNGADVTIKDNQGRTALDLALTKSIKDLLKQYT